MMRAAVPVLKIPLAWICLFLNLFIPGLGKNIDDKNFLNFSPKSLLKQEQSSLVGSASVLVIPDSPKVIIGVVESGLLSLILSSGYRKPLPLSSVWLDGVGQFGGV